MTPTPQNNPNTNPARFDATAHTRRNIALQRKVQARLMAHLARQSRRERWTHRAATLTAHAIAAGVTAALTVAAWLIMRQLIP